MLFVLQPAMPTGIVCASLVVVTGWNVEDRMPFEHIERKYTNNLPGGRGSYPGLVGVVRVSMSKHSKSPHPMNIRLAADVVADLSWKAGDRIVVLFGTGMDFGTVMLVRDNRGLKLHHNGKAQSLTLCVSVLPDYISRAEKHKPQTVPHRISNSALLVDLPAWATAPASAAKAAAE